MRIASLLVLLIIVSSSAFADQPALAAAANAARSGDYRTAVRNYEVILDKDGFSAPVLFNLGNAWLRLGNPARAILDYERALVLSPHSAGIEANLAAAQQRAGLAPQAEGSWLAAARYFSFDTYVWTGLGALWVLCFALVLVCLNGVARRIARPLILLAVVTLCGSADAAVLEWPDLQRAVVVTPAVMHLAPAQSAATSGALQEGEVVWLQEHYAGFNLVRTADGRTGWVGDAAAVAVRVPRP
ncbi:MAG TPA: tetratricopeptide repeat protein [Steroidobacteraceae bacterium]